MLANIPDSITSTYNICQMYLTTSLAGFMYSVQIPVLPTGSVEFKQSVKSFQLKNVEPLSVAEEFKIVKLQSIISPACISFTTISASIIAAQGISNETELAFLTKINKLKYSMPYLDCYEIIAAASERAKKHDF